MGLRFFLMLMRFPISLIGIFAFHAALFGGEATTERVKEPLEKTAQRWAGFDFFGCSLNLKSDEELRWYLFHKDGWVSVTAGLKKGARMAPLWRWQINGQWLQILDEEGRVVFQMRPVKITNKEFSVENGLGKIEVFEIQGNDERSKKASPERK